MVKQAGAPGENHEKIIIWNCAMCSTKDLKKGNAVCIKTIIHCLNVKKKKEKEKKKKRKKERKKKRH